jgi:hypothetical protein
MDIPISYFVFWREEGKRMYRISRNEGYLLVKFIDDFDFPTIQTAIKQIPAPGPNPFFSW